VHYFEPINQGNSGITLTQLTAGGRSEALIATPTKDPELPPSMESATPAPEGIATIAPTAIPRSNP